MTDATPTLYVGIDVSKASLEVHLRYAGQKKGQGFATPNTAAGLASLSARLKALEPKVVAMEATGGYERACAVELGRNDITFAIVNAKYIRKFAEADGTYHKTDPIDAALIARYAEKMEPRPWKPISDADLEFEGLTRRRRQLVEMLVREKNHREHSSGGTRPLIERDIVDLESKIEEIETLLREHVDQQPDLARKREILDSPKGIGEATATKILCLLPEIGELTNKEAAKLGGLAPFADDSGLSTKKRKCEGGRAELRAALYMPTLAAIRWNPTINPFYERLVAKGKPKQLVVIACMRKFLVILNAMVRDNRIWEDPAK
jgi:transposase